VSIGSASFKTKIHKKTLDPVWDETFVFKVNPDDDINAKFELYDWDRMSSDGTRAHTHAC
jgi:Ca2+-dependent lipid-binding protein